MVDILHPALVITVNILKRSKIAGIFMSRIMVCVFVFLVFFSRYSMALCPEFDPSHFCSAENTNEMPVVEFRKNADSHSPSFPYQLNDTFFNAHLDHKIRTLE